MYIYKQQSGKNKGKDTGVCMPTRQCLCTHTGKLTGKLPTCGPQQEGTLQLPIKCTHPVIWWGQQGTGCHRWIAFFCVAPQQDRYSLAPCMQPWRGGHLYMLQYLCILLILKLFMMLALMVAQTLSAKVEVWLAFRTGKSFWYLSAHKITFCLGAEKSRALPMFHAITGCDTSTAFVGHGKKVHGLSGIPCQKWHDALLRLACTPTEILEQSMPAIERFFILMYDRTSICTNVNKARKKLFAKNSLCRRFHQHVLLWNSMSESRAVFHARWSYLGSNTYPTACASFSK